MIRDDYLRDVVSQLRKYKELADRAISQVSEDQLFTALEPESNSIAIVMKHMAGNMRSRWTDFLTSDGEKPDRHRDREFELEDADSRASLLARWEAGWRLTLETISSLDWQDLEKTVTIRAAPHTPHRRRGGQPSAQPLRLPRGADCAAGAILRRRRMGVFEHSEGEVGGVRGVERGSTVRRGGEGVVAVTTASRWRG